MSYYQLSYSGPEVDEALGRVLNEEPADPNVSHIKDLESTETVPYNLDNLVETGIFRCMYLDPATVPEEVAKAHPVFIFAASVEGASPGTGYTTQTITIGLKNYTRSSSDGGTSWSEWDYPKEITAAEVLAMFQDEGASAEILSRVMTQIASKSAVNQNSATTSTKSRKAINRGYAS